MDANGSKCLLLIISVSIESSNALYIVLQLAIAAEFLLVEECISIQSDKVCTCESTAYIYIFCDHNFRNEFVQTSP